MGFFSKKIRPLRVVLLFVALSGVLIVGLWSYDRITDPVGHNLRKLVYGMSMAEVKSLLGEPHRVSTFLSETQWTYRTRHAGNGRYIMLGFRDGRLFDSSDKGLPRWQ